MIELFIGIGIGIIIGVAGVKAFWFGIPAIFKSYKTILSERREIREWFVNMFRSFPDTSSPL